jgi:tetratricopeptide (TPR) repeat protein
VSQFEPAATPNAVPVTGAVLAERYVLGALLGKGGMGHVYAARDRKLQRDVAIKLVGAATPDREALRRFSREALAAGSLQHPNVVAVFDAGEESGRPYLVTELLRGGTLRQLLELGPLPLGRAQSIARQVAAGLAAAHDKGFTHRDLKPENIFITDDGWVKILDFGLVKLTESLQISPPPEAGSTGAGRTLGTIGYMAPEQVRGQPVDPRADLFNFGVVVYEMLCGERAFKGGSSTETSYAILFREPVPLPASAPRELRRLVERCLAKDREHRPASAREVLALLQTMEARPRRKLPGKRFWAGVLLAAAIAGLGFLVYRAPKGLLQKPVAGSPNVTAPITGAVAILPFDSHDAPKFASLAEGVGDLLARDLEGSQLRAVEPASVLRAVRGEPINDVDRARGAAVRLNAKYFVLGRIEERKGELVLEAVLHDGGAGEPLVTAGARGNPAEVLRLVRKLSDQLQNVTRTQAEFDARLADLTRRTSRSTEALQAWLEGERLLRRGHFWDAAGAFQQAVAADPEFALALYRLGFITGQYQPGQSEDALQRALHYGDRLSPAERLLVEAHLAVQHGALTDAQQFLETATREHPADPEVWMELADFHFHEGPLKGRSPQEAESALQQVLVLDPLNIDAITHLADLAQLRGERAVVSRLTDRLLSLTDDVSKSIDFRLARAWARGDQAEHDEVLAKLRAPDTTAQVLVNAMVRTEWQMDGSSDPLTIASLAPYADGFQPMASADLIRGRFDAARQVFAAAAATNPAGDGAYYRLWIDTLEFVPVSPARLAASRAAAARLEIKDPSRVPAQKYMLGLLAVHAKDFAAAEEAAHTLETMQSLAGSSITTDLAMVLRAQVLAAQGNAAAALALLDKQQLRIPAGLASIYGRAGINFFRASLLRKLNRQREALPLYDALVFYSRVEPIFAPTANLNQGQIYDDLGEKQRAIEHYEKFAEMWKTCEPELQPLVELVRARLIELRASKDK